jgi:protein TonB
MKYGIFFLFFISLSAFAQSDIIQFPDLDAQFPGGTEKMQRWISRNVKYPSYAIEKGIQGKVFVSFIVEKNGKITTIKVERGVHSSLDAEAIRLVSKMPNWIPGKHNGKKARVICRLPINFTLT